MSKHYHEFTFFLCADSNNIFYAHGVFKILAIVPLYQLRDLLRSLLWQRPYPGLYV